MATTPTTPSATATAPLPDQQGGAFARYVLQELQSISSAIQTQAQAAIQAAAVAPQSPLIGTVRYATGDWATSLGAEGLYVYKQAGWTLLASPSDISSAVSAGVAPLANPNKFYNPVFLIDQRNEGTAISGSSINGYAVDGLAAAVSAVTASSVERVTDAPTGYPYSVKFTNTTGLSSVGATTYMAGEFRIESCDLADMGWGTSAAKPVTLSVWLKASSTGTFGGSLRNGAITRSYPFTFTITAANTWQLFTVTVPGDTAGSWNQYPGSLGLSVWITAGCGSAYLGTPNAWASANYIAPTGISNTLLTTSGATFQIGPVKLEVGSTATPLLIPSFEECLAKCQRYFEKSYDPGVKPGTATATEFVLSVTSATDWWTNYPFKVTKRAVPTITVYSISGASGKVNLQGTDVAAATQTTQCNGFNGSFITGASAGQWFEFQWTAEAGL